MNHGIVYVSVDTPIWEKADACGAAPQVPCSDASGPGSLRAGHAVHQSSHCQEMCMHLLVPVPVTRGLVQEWVPSQLSGRCTLYSCPPHIYVYDPQPVAVIPSHGEMPSVSPFLDSVYPPPPHHHCELSCNRNSGEEMGYIGEVGHHDYHPSHAMLDVPLAHLIL